MNPVGQRHPGSPAAHKYAGTAKSHRKMILYPFQIEAKEAVLRHWESGHKAALVSLPTGSGKTIVFSDVLQSSLSGRNDKALVLVHRDELLRQSLEKLNFVWPGVKLSTVDAASSNFAGQITVASVMSVVRRLDKIPRMDKVVTDEAHHAPASSWLKIYKRLGELFPDWQHVGVTATPIRNKGASDLEAIFGKPVYVKSIFELIVEGYLSPLKGLEVKTEISVEDVGIQGGDFIAEELSRVINTKERNQMVVENYLELAVDRKALVFAADLNHARSLAEMFKTQGVSAAWVSGETPLNSRRSFLEKLRNGELKVIVNCMVFTEGFDEPSLDAILVARPTRSLVLYCQMIGRGLRPYPGKKNCLFIDFVDNSSKHRLISMQDLLMFYQTKRTEKNIAELLAKKLAKERQNSSGNKGQKSPVIDLSPTNLPLLVNLENLSSSVKEIDLFGLDAFAWYKAGESHYVQVNDAFSLVIRPDLERPGHVLYAIFPKSRFYASLLDGPVDFDLAYGCGNAYLFDYGDRYLAAKGSQWRNGKPTDVQKDLFQRLRDKLKDISAGSISFAEPGVKKGDYGAAIAALNAEMVLLSGRKIESEEARQFIKQNLHARVGGEQPIALTINGHGDATIEAALKRAIATFSQSQKGDFFNYLKKILLENQILLEGNHVRISHVKFPGCMTEKQMKAVKDRIEREIRLHAPVAEVSFCGFPASTPKLSNASTSQRDVHQLCKIE
jgi:superfamily II DNA or RNA helicase